MHSRVINRDRRSPGSDAAILTLDTADALVSTGLGRHLTFKVPRSPSRVDRCGCVEAWHGLYGNTFTYGRAVRHTLGTKLRGVGDRTQLWHGIQSKEGRIHSASAILGHHLNPNGDHQSVLDLIVYRWIHHLSSTLNLRASRPRLVLEIFMFLRHRQRIRMTISCSRRWKTPCRQRMMGRGPSRILLMLSAAFRSRLTNL